MKPGIIFMTLLLSGVLYSCNLSQIDYITTIEKIYSNDTDFSVELIGYSTEKVSIQTYNWKIEANSSISFQYELPNGYEVHPTICDSLKIVFDDGKQLLYKNGEGLLVYDRMEEIAKREYRYYYTITKQMYDFAE